MITSLSDIQKQIIEGSLLGDGYLMKIVRKNDNSRFDEGHGIGQLDWLKWKYDALLPFSKKLVVEETPGRKNENGKVVNDPSRTYQRCMYATGKNKLFTDLEKKWYKRDDNGNYVLKQVGKLRHRIKILPDDFRLTRLSASVWYLDDGHNFFAGKRCCIYSLAFTESEVQRLLGELHSLGFHSSKILQMKTNQFYIAISKESYTDFISMVENEIKNIPQCVTHKIDLSKCIPRTTICHKDEISTELIDAMVEDYRSGRFVSQRDIARKHNIDYRLVNGIFLGKIYQHLSKHGNIIS
jgi:hypothetical protein